MTVIACVVAFVAGAAAALGAQHAYRIRQTWLEHTGAAPGRRVVGGRAPGQAVTSVPERRFIDGHMQDWPRGSV